MSNDFAWLTEHSLVINEKYCGKWIAVLNGEIVGVGDSAPEAAQKADEAHPGANCILEAVDPETEQV